MDNITGSISNNGQYSFVIVGEHKFIPENLYLELQQQNKELQDKLSKAVEALQDIEMSPRILHKDNLAQKMQNIASDFLLKNGINL